MAYAFATAEDYEARWGAVPADEQGIVSATLDDAGLMLRSKVAVDEGDQELMDRLKMVSLNMAKRAMATYDGGVYGASQTDAQMGPFQQSVHWSNPSGDLYVTAAEKDLLGIDSAWVASIPARIEGWYGSNG